MTTKPYMDQMGREVRVQGVPKRIVSLVPSQTELLVDLGLEQQLVGVTKFCVHPSGLRQKKAIIGRTKHFRFEVIDQLEPDLIIGNKEENYKEGIERLVAKYPVWMSDIFTLEDALEMMEGVGQLTGRNDMAKELVQEIGSRFRSGLEKKGTAVYLIWQGPYMAAGKKTFIHEMLAQAGFENLIGQDRYPEVTLEEIRELVPDVIMLSSEPFPFQAKHARVLQKEFPRAKVMLVDGEMFSWYGSRLRLAMDYFKSL